MSLRVIYLITCKVCQKQYVESTITTFRKRFNHRHHGTYDDIKVHIIDYCDPNDQERREDFWIFNINALEPNGLNNKRVQKN